MATLAQAITATADRRAAEPALWFDGEWLTYAALSAGAAAVQASLSAAGVLPRDRVGVGFLNSPRLVMAVLGVLRAGAVLVPINPAYTEEELRYVVNDAKLAAVFAEPGHGERLLQDGFERSVWTGLEHLPKDKGPLPTPVAPHDAALIIYTSGTTGRPKGAVLSHAALLSNLTTVAAAWHWTERDRLLLTLPCFHLHGLGLGLLTSFLVGSSVVLKTRFAAESLYAELAQHKCTMFFGVPTMYNRLAGLPAGIERQTDLRHMRMWVSGSAPLSAVTFERFRERHGCELMDRYGMTECGFVLSTPYDEPRRPGVVGRPLPGVDVRLIDPDSADRGALDDVTDGTPGEIVVRGPNLFTGYWQRPQDTERAMLAGYLRTGDVALRESDGQFRIIGRRSLDIIKTRGFKVGAGEIEEVLQEHPSIQDVAVVGIADSDQGERIVAVYTLRPGSHVTGEALLAHARQHLAPHKLPTELIEMPELPRTGPGKIKKSELIVQLSRRRQSASG
jgi:acyl-CoA synthetase (AMP-forming)/AMP-acid ligase II